MHADEILLVLRDRFRSTVKRRLNGPQLLKQMRTLPQRWKLRICGLQRLITTYSKELPEIHPYDQGC